MTQFTIDAFANQKMRNAVDWTVFTLGAASLTIAIVASLMSTNSDMASSTGDALTLVISAS